MKSKELRKIIREAIADVLNEDMSADKAAQDAKKIAIDKEIIALQKTKAELGKETSPLAEDNVDEMARIPKGYRLTDDNVDTTRFTKTISGTSLADVINYFRENPGTDKKALQTQFNFARPQIANAIVNGLMDAGVLTKLGAGGEEEAPGAQAQAPAATDAEDMFVGGSENPLAMYFDGEPNNDGSEDFEPEAGEIEKAAPVQIGKVSDADFEASLKYSDLDRRLAATKSNILKLRKGRTSAGDISDRPSTELQRLRDLKVSLEKRLEDLYASSAYLSQRQEKTTGKKTPPPPPIEPEEIEDEEPLDEWAISRAQYYAGIKK
jgi:hypothetical protein